MSNDPGTPSHPPTRRHPPLVCGVCGQQKARGALVPFDLVRPGITELVRAAHPKAPADGYICHDDLARYRAAYVGKMLSAERGELSKLEREVVESLARYDTVSADVETAFVERRTFGERLADTMAAFGGSWTFILIFMTFIVVWMAANSIAVMAGKFDPYPYILLNLVLSCLAALQAPVIMMSQKRQEAKDRMRSENDYRVNLKAELEIRHLHEKIDHLLTRQWDRLMEIQEIQLELMQDLAGGKA
jgi:uncharacterized membrane protein